MKSPTNFGEEPKLSEDNVMGLVNIDLRFVDIDLELDRLDDFLGILEKQLASAIKKEQKKAEQLIKKYRKNTDEAELRFVEQRLTDLVDDTLPRFFRGPFISSYTAPIRKWTLRRCRG
jgi:hypothetical protein